MLSFITTSKSIYRQGPFRLASELNKVSFCQYPLYSSKGNFLISKFVPVIVLCNFILSVNNINLCGIVKCLCTILYIVWTYNGLNFKPQLTHTKFISLSNYTLLSYSLIDTSTPLKF